MASPPQQKAVKPAQTAKAKVAGRRRGRSKDPESGSATQPNGLRIRVFDADREDRVLGLDEAMALDLTERQLLWIDANGEVDSATSDVLTRRFDLDPATERGLVEPTDRPHVALHGGYFHLRLVVEPDARRPQELHWLDIVAGRNVVITRHADRLRFLDAMDERIADDASIGSIDASDFVTSLLDSVVTSYLAAVDSIEDDVDVIDTKALARESFDDLFTELVDVRRRVSRLRRVLAAHRELFGSLARRDFARGTDSADPDAFQAVAARFEAALSAVEETREVVLGSFDVLMTRTSQRTNDVMRALTVATVLALPATLIASFLGMNVVTPVPGDNPVSFWAVVLFVVGVIAAMLLVARARRWL